MNKIFAIGFGIIAVLALLVVGYLVLVSRMYEPDLGGGSKNSNTSPIPDYTSTVTSPGSDAGTSSNGGEPVVSPGHNQITIKGTNSVSISVNEFIGTTDTVEDSANPGRYFLGYHYPQSETDTTGTDMPPYIISFNKTTEFFNVVLEQEPVAQIRKDAEQYLLKKLGVSEAALCQLSYSVSVPNRINSFYSGKNLGFSFCPGATPL